MPTDGKVVRVDFRAKERLRETAAPHPLEKLAALIASQISTREQMELALDPIAAGIRSADLPQAIKGTDGLREKINLSICRSAARYRDRVLDVHLSASKAEEVLMSLPGKAFREVRLHYREMLARACLTPNAIPDAMTISATITDLKARWQNERAALLISAEFKVLSSYLSPDYLKRLVPEFLIEGDPTAIVNDLCLAYSLYKHISDHLPRTREHRNEMLLIQDELNRIARQVPTIIFDGSPPKQILALQMRLNAIKVALKKVKEQITPETAPGNFANIARAREVNMQVRAETKQTDGDNSLLIDCAAELIAFIENNYLHATALYNKLKKWPPEVQDAFIAYMIDKYKLTGPVRARLERTLAKRAGTP